jgi:hypothetical protein
MKHLTHIEPLESRIAPAIIINPYTVTYQDATGQTAIIHISKPLFSSATAAGKILMFTNSAGTSVTETFTGNTTAESLNEIDLLGVTAAQDMNISVKVIPQVGEGSFTVDVGAIVAGNFSNFQASQNIDLGSIYIQGNLGEIDAGDDFSTPAITSLNVMSMEQVFSGGGSTVLGPIVHMNVLGDFTTYMDIIGYQFGAIGTLKIGGSLSGDSALDSDTGLIQFSGHITSATIGSITGTAGNNTGELLGSSVTSQSYIGSLHVLGSITGGNGVNSSTGASAVDSGLVSVAARIGAVNVGGSLMGGSGGIAANGISAATPGDTGVIQALSIGKITIGGSLVGGTPGTGTNTDGVADQTADTGGAILANGVNSLTILGSITGGGGPNSGGLQINILNSLTVGGSITGGSGANSGVISGESLALTTKFGSIRVDGDVMGGSGDTSGAIMSNGAFEGTISSLHIGGSLVGSSGTQSGYISATTDVGTVGIVGSVMGGSAGTAASSTASAVHGYSGVIQAASAKSIAIGGSLAGGTPVTNSSGAVTQSADTSGAILVDSFNSLSITGSITGSAGPNSGLVSGDLDLVTNFGAIRVDGGVIGGAGAISGAIMSDGSSSGTLASLHIGGNLIGRSGTESGYISATGAVKALGIAGSVLGGTGDQSGEISAGGELALGVIHGGLIGNTKIDSKTAVVGSGYILAGEIGMLDIVGNVASGANSGGAIANSGAIRSSADILSLVIGGTVTGSAANPVFISATEGPSTSAHPKTDLAIQSVTIHEAATYLDVLAGYSPVVSTTTTSGNTTTTNPAGAPLGTPTDGAAQIGTVTFGSTLSASNIVAGAEPDSKGQFGTTGNTAIKPATGKTGLMSSIAEIIIAGQATGNKTAGDSFGFVAEKLEEIEIDGKMVSTDHLVPGTPVAVNGNLFLLEVKPAT